MAGDIESLRLHLAIEKFSAILGHSNGGTIALVYAEMFPDRVGKLILLNHRVLGLELESSSQSGGEEKEEDVGEDETISRSSHSAIDQRLTDAWVKVLPAYFYDPATSLPKFRSAMGDTLIDSWCLTKQKRYDQRSPVGQWMVAHLGDVRADVLLIFGKQDIICPLSNAERTTRDVDNVDMIVLDDCGHFPWIENEETLEKIASFLQT